MSKNNYSKINFYYVDTNYIDFLKQAELAERGFSCVPNIQYAKQNRKFLYGAVLEVNDVRYFVPVSSQYGKMVRDAKKKIFQNSGEVRQKNYYSIRLR